MKNILFFTTIILLSWSSIIAQPLMIYPDTINYGTIPQYSDPERSFYIHNEGTEPLEILHITGSCACLYPEYNEVPLVSGDSALFKIFYDTERLGPFIKSLSIKTNEGLIRKLVAKGRVEPTTSTKAVDTNLTLQIVATSQYLRVDNQSTESGIYSTNMQQANIFDLSGKPLQSYQGILPFQIPINNFPSGLYLLVVQSDKLDRQSTIFYKP